MSDPTPQLYLAALCYGGTAHARFLRSLLALEEACAAHRLPLRLDLGGGDALVGRGRASVLARFLESGASHLLFVDPQVAFTPADVLRLLAADKEVIGAEPCRGEVPARSAAAPRDGDTPVAAVDAGFMMIRRDAAARMSRAYPALRARLGDVHAAHAGKAVMLFDSMIDPQTGQYLTDDESFCRRWRDLGGVVWLAASVQPVGAA